MAMKYSKEQLNYFRIRYGVTDVLTEGLRIIFKQEWDNRYGATTLGEWKDEPRNGVDFKNMESARNQKRHARLLTTMIGGNRAEWDYSSLSMQFVTQIVFTASAQLSKQMSMPSERFELNLCTFRKHSFRTCSFKTSLAELTLHFKRSVSPRWKFKSLRIKRAFQRRNWKMSWKWLTILSRNFRSL